MFFIVLYVVELISLLQQVIKALKKHDVFEWIKVFSINISALVCMVLAIFLSFFNNAIIYLFVTYIALIVFFVMLLIIGFIFLKESKIIENKKIKNVTEEEKFNCWFQPFKYIFVATIIAWLVSFII